MARACTHGDKGPTITKGCFVLGSPVCPEREKETMSDEVLASTKSRGRDATDKICYSAFVGKYIHEADEPHGSNEGSIAVETESKLEDEDPSKFDRSGEEAIGDLRHPNLVSTKNLHKNRQVTT